METKKYTYASIVPLIGGESIGLSQALEGQLPEYVLSYTPFAANDSHYINYLREVKGWNGDYVFLDENPDYIPKQVDVVNAVCPCSGLSSLSVSSNADSKTNDWMYKTAEDVLSKIRPKVFWGENAPRLYSKTGKKVADRLYAIGKKYGYSLNVYYTESRLHGLSQKRPRTFYFFTKGDTAPLFKYFRKESEPVEDVLGLPEIENDPMNVLVNKNDPKDNPWVKYALHRTGANNLRELYDKFDGTTNMICIADKGLGEDLNQVAEWFDSQGLNKVADRARRMQKKVDEGKGYWGHGETLCKGIIPSLIGVMPGAMINAHKEQYLTLRDCLRIMKMPDDFNLLGEDPVKNVNHIAQNVPVTTAQDMMYNVIDFLEGRCQDSGTSYVKQSNKNYAVHDMEPKNEVTESLDSFM